MNVVRDTIGLCKFQFSHPKTQARILTGAEEGLFSWISVNYVTGKFGVVGELYTVNSPCLKTERKRERERERGERDFIVHIPVHVAFF